MDPIQEKKIEETTTAPDTQLPTQETEAITPDALVPQATADEKNCFLKKNSLWVSLGVALFILLGAGGYAYTMYYAQGGVVATVNGDKIYRNALNESIALIEKSATAQGIDISAEGTPAEIQTQALEGLISNTLILSSAKKAGITASADEVKAKYDELVAELGTEENLTARMAEIGLTQEKLQNNIKERIITDKYLEAETEIKTLTVTDEEVAEFVKSINTGETKLPPLEEIRPQIEAQILGQKQQQLVLEFLTKLREEADVTIKI